MTLSIQNNNPGNLRGTNGDFRSFKSAEDGLSAMKRDLILKLSGNSRAMAGKDPTLTNVLNTWAPPSENDTQGYIQFVADKTGIDPNEKLTADHADAIMPAMIEREGGPEASKYFGSQTLSMADQSPKTFNVELPDGTTLEGIPEGTTKDQIKQKLQAGGYDITKLDAPVEKVNEAPVETPAEPTFGSRAAETITQGKQDIQTAMNDYNSGAISAPEGALEAVKKGGADVVSGLAGDALAQYTPQFVKDAGSNVLARLNDSPIGDLAHSALQKYADFSQDHPRVTRDAENAVGLGAFMAGARPDVAKNVGAAVGDATVKGAKGLGKAALFPIRAPAEIAAQLATRPDLIQEAPKVVELARKYNVPLGLDDIADSAHYKTLISEGKTLPFANAGESTKIQNDAFTKAVSNSIGLDTPTLTPEQVDKAFTKIGGKFDSFFDGKNVDLGKDYGVGLRQKDFLEEVGDNYASDGKALLQKYMGKINSAIDETGTVDGTELGKIRNKVAKIARTSGNPEIKGAARDMDNFIVDAVSESHAVPTQALADFKNAKYQYKNLIAIEPLAQKDQLRGYISPAQLLGRVRQVYGRGFSKGDAGELGDLANLGQYIKDHVPNSGTSQRAATRKLLTGNISAAVPTAVLGGPAGLAAQAGLNGLGLASNRAIQRLNMSPAKIDSALKRLAKKSGDSLLQNQALKKLEK